MESQNMLESQDMTELQNMTESQGRMKKQNTTESQELLLDRRSWWGRNQPGLESAEADVVLMGVAYEWEKGEVKGAAQGPSALRHWAWNRPCCTERLESLEELKMLDLGDFTQGSRKEIFSQVRDCVCKLTSEERFFVVLGGDSSCVIPVEAGVDKGLDEPFGIISFGAQLNLREREEGDRYAPGTAQRRALELDNIDGLGNLYFVGSRTITSEERAFRKRHSLRLRTAYDCYRFGTERVAEEVTERLERFSRVLLTLDMNCLDPSAAPGVARPEAGGFQIRQMLEMLRMLFEHLPIMGIQINNVIPKLDPAQITAGAAGKLLVECFGHQARKLGKLR